ncbi:MAG: chemotaxis protein CheA [Cyanobacteriota bacterium]
MNNFNENDINFILEDLEDLELALLDFEQSLKDNIDTSEMVHIIFRHAHNLKGSISSLNKIFSAKLIHSIESNFDLIRKGNVKANKEFIQKCLSVLGHIKIDLVNLEEDNEKLSKLVDELENHYQFDKNNQKIIENISLFLDNNEYNYFKNLDDKKLNYFQIEKLITSDITKEKYDYMPIYDDIKEIGFYITTMPKFSDINKNLEHSILKIYFATNLTETDLEMYIFDTVKPVNIKAFLGEENSFDENLSENLFIESSNEYNFNLIDENIISKYANDTFDLLFLIEVKILELESNEFDKNTISEIMGYIHNIKGNSGFVGALEIEKNCIEIENIFSSLLNEKTFLDKSLISNIILKLNLIKTYLESFINKNNKNLEDKSEEISNADFSNENKYNLVKRDIKIDIERIDTLFNLVGELITAESILINSPELKDIKTLEFKRNSVMLNKIIRELYETTMLIRMIRIESLFNKMKMLVRDLSQKTGKEINFIISGQETEMDKNIIEEISNPLIHLIRNAIDHGIESKEERIKKGKNPIGTLKLSAKYQANQVLIIIQDDGKGLNKAKIINKIKEKGLIKNFDESFSDNKIFDFIFEPGFSTSENITDISGRGVGMDVVKKNIEKLRGKILIKNIEDQGCSFILSVPLTVAVIEAIMIRIGTVQYALPINSIKKSFRPDKSSITVTMDGIEVVDLRDNLYTIIRLHDYFNIKTNILDLDKGILIIINSNEKKVCFFADEILGQQQVVIKGFDDYLGNINGIIGYMILSSGEVGFILDTDKIIEQTEK